MYTCLDEPSNIQSTNQYQPTYHSTSLPTYHLATHQATNLSTNQHPRYQSIKAAVPNHANQPANPPPSERRAGLASYHATNLPTVQHPPYKSIKATVPNHANQPTKLPASSRLLTCFPSGPSRLRTCFPSSQSRKSRLLQEGIRNPLKGPPNRNKAYTAQVASERACQVAKAAKAASVLRTKVSLVDHRNVLKNVKCLANCWSHRICASQGAQAASTN